MFPWAIEKQAESYTMALGVEESISDSGIWCQKKEHSESE